MITYIISDTRKAVFFEHTSLLLREKGVELNFILINCRNTALSDFLEEHSFEVAHLDVGRVLFSFSAILQCRRILKQRKTRIIHCHLGTANWVGLWAGKLAGTKQRVFTRHAGEPLNIGSKEKMIDKIQNRLATDIVAISLNILELLQRQGAEPGKLTIIHHGFDLSRFSAPNPAEVERIRKQYNPGQQNPVIGVIARWMEWKGIQFTIEAFKTLLNDYPNARLCLFNASDSGDYAPELNRLLAGLPESSYSKIDFEDNVYDLYQLFDVYVHVPVNPSCEAFGQTYVESLAAGIPSVFTLSGIAREFVNPENALVVPFRDANRIAEGIKTLLGDENLRHKLSSRGKQDVIAQFELDVYIRNLMKLYHIAEGKSAD
ncbi:MAG: glycosyltransferase family 4 protein [Bacteroidota bacterium]